MKKLFFYNSIARILFLLLAPTLFRVLNFAFHYSADGNYWNLVRYFMFEEAENISIGFSSQSPTGESCTSVFSDIGYREKYLEDIRGGE